MGLEKLREELRDADLEQVSMETELLKLRQEAGLIVLKEGSRSNAFKQIRKKIQESDQKLEDLKILGEAIREAIKQGEKKERQRIDAETLKKNREILEKYAKNLPKCPKCKTNEAVSFVEALPRGHDQTAHTQSIELLVFQCDRLFSGHQFSIHRTEFEGLTGKIEEAGRKIGSAAASLL